MPIPTSFSIPLDTVVYASFLFILGVYAIFTAILYYHWKTYATDQKVTALTLGMYFVTTIPLLLVMGIMLLIL